MRRAMKKLDKAMDKQDVKTLRKLEGKRKRHIFRRLVLICAALTLAGVIAGYYVFDVPNWKKLDVSRITSVQQTGAMYDRSDQLMTAIKGSQDRIVISLPALPAHVKNAFIAAEDVRFYRHPGFDPVRILGAAVANLKRGGYSQGASTITQQLIKLSHLSAEKTISRKLQEVYLAVQLESLYEKDDILAMYLNFVYFGRGAYGVEAASRAYFGVGAAELSIAQAAALAATIKAPSAYSPSASAEANAKRRQYVLGVMLENGMLAQADYDAAMAEDVAALPVNTEKSADNWYTDAVLDEAEALLGISGDALLGGGYRIYTAFDPEYQRIADAQYEKASMFPDAAADGVKPQSAMACVDTRSGAVLCVVGGREYTVQRGLNRATAMRRQPGSAIKPLAVYAPAIEYYGRTTASVLNDTPTSFGKYTPRNSGNSYHGLVTIRQALKWSMNVAAVSLLDQIGVAAGRAYLEKVGIPLADADWGLSLALGSMTYGVSPVLLAAAYAPFANGGVYYPPYFIRRIEDSLGNALYTRQATGSRVLSEETAYLMTSLLQSVTSAGTGAKLSAAGTPVAGKTGTVNMTGGGNRDIWMAAYNANISTAFWIGYDNPDAAHRLPSWVSGGDHTAALATAFFKAAYAGKSKPAFATPGGIVWQTIDRASVEWLGEAMLATQWTPKSYQYSEVFSARNKIVKKSTAWRAPASPSAFYVTHNDAGNPVLCITAAETALFRVQRDSEGESIILTELLGNAGQTVYFADARARQGVVYTYRVIPIHYELLQNGILLEGKQSVQIAKARSPAAGISLMDGLRRILGMEEDAKDGSAETSLFDAP